MDDEEEQEFTPTFSAPDAKVLIVDDTMSMRKIIKGRLTRYAIMADECESGAEAVEAVKANRFDLVFMDNIMPSMTGTDATKSIRAMGNNIPIIACDRIRVGEPQRETFKKNGFTDFLTKPFDDDQLDDILVQWLPQEKRK